MSHNIFFIALGGALGSVARHLLTLVIGPPLGTAIVNVLGSFMIGVLFVALLEPKGASAGALFLITGVLGGFTTFSAFSLDTLKLVESGQALQAGLYVAGSVLVSLGAVALGAAVARGVLA